MFMGNWLSPIPHKSLQAWNANKRMRLRLGCPHQDDIYLFTNVNTLRLLTNWRYPFSFTVGGFERTSCTTDSCENGFLPINTHCPFCMNSAFLFNYLLMFCIVWFKIKGRYQRLLTAVKSIWKSIGETFFQRDSIPVLVSRTVKTRKFKLLYFRNETWYGNGNLYNDLLFVYLQPNLNKNRTIARWRHFTTTTRILEFVVFFCKLRLLFLNPQRDWQI